MRYFEQFEPKSLLTAYLVQDHELSLNPFLRSTPTVIGDTAYFAAQTLDSVTQFWRTDGTAEGTEQISELRSASGEHFGLPQNFRIGDRVVYFNRTGQAETTIWSVPGDQVVKVDTLNGSLTASVEYDGGVAFVLETPPSENLFEQEFTLYWTDGFRVEILASVRDSTYQLMVADEALLLVSQTAMYQFDGDELQLVANREILSTAFAWNEKVVDIERENFAWFIREAPLFESNFVFQPDEDPSLGSRKTIYSLGSVDGTLFSSEAFFIGVTYQNGSELWQSDGTSSGTRRILKLQDRQVFQVSVIEGQTYIPTWSADTLETDFGVLQPDGSLKTLRTFSSDRIVRIVTLSDGNHYLHVSSPFALQGRNDEVYQLEGEILKPLVELRDGERLLDLTSDFALITAPGTLPYTLDLLTLNVVTNERELLQTIAMGSQSSGAHPIAVSGNELLVRAFGRGELAPFPSNIKLLDSAVTLGTSYDRGESVFFYAYEYDSKTSAHTNTGLWAYNEGSEELELRIRSRKNPWTFISTKTNCSFSVTTRFG